MTQKKERKRRGFTATGLVEVAELIRRLRRYSPRAGVTFTEGLHSDVFVRCQRTSRGIVAIRVR